MRQQRRRNGDAPMLNGTMQWGARPQPACGYIPPWILRIAELVDGGSPRYQFAEDCQSAGDRGGAEGGEEVTVIDAAAVGDEELDDGEGGVCDGDGEGGAG